jgi:hypothetical protein
MANAVCERAGQVFLKEQSFTAVTIFFFIALVLFIIINFFSNEAMVMLPQL